MRENLPLGQDLLTYTPIGGCALLLGFILVAIGASRLRVKALMPNKTIQQVQHDAATAKQQMRQSYDLQRAA